MIRKFSVDINELADKTPILPAGVYEGIVAFCASQGKEGKEYIQIADQYKYVNKTRIATGEKELTGMLVIGAVLTDQKAKDILLQDEPRVYGNIRLRFNQETGILDMLHNVALRQVVGLFDIDFSAIQAEAESSIDWDSLEIPEELQAIPNIETLYQAMIFHREVFMRLCIELNGKPARVAVANRPNSQNKSVMEHCMDNGTSQSPFCGFLVTSDV